MKNLKSILGVIAPTLATAMGGPLGGMAMKMVAACMHGNLSIKNPTRIKLGLAEDTFVSRMAQSWNT